MTLLYLLQRPIHLSLNNRELKGEANRILTFDYGYPSTLSSRASSVDFAAIDRDVLNALKWLRYADAMEKPDLTQDVGILVSDDVVPASLHREVILYFF